MSALEKLARLKKYFVEEGLVKPNRKCFVFSSDHVRSLFRDLVSTLGYENFYVSTIVATDLIGENKIRLDYHVVLLPDEVSVVFRTYLRREDPVIDSVVDIVPGVLSGECETHDLVGVIFRGNPHARRGFFVPKDLVEKNVYPLRKDAKV